MEKKQTYETPSLEKYVFELEGCVAQSLVPGSIPGSEETEGDWN